MATIVLVRHATTAVTGKRLSGRTPGVHLDERGRAAAEAAAERLAGLPVAAVYSSPLDRTLETAAPIARRHRLRVRRLDGVNETDYGEWTDRTFGQLRRARLWRLVHVAPSRVTFPGGESIRAVQTRAVEAIERLAVEHGDETIVVVTHSDVVKLVVAHHIGTPLDLFERLDVAPASITVLQVPRDGPSRLIRLNDTGPMGGS